MENNGQITIYLPMNKARETTLSDNFDSICLVSSLREHSQDLTELPADPYSKVISGWMGPS